MHYQYVSCEPVSQEDIVVRTIARKYQLILSPEQGVFYDRISRMPVVEEAKKILSWIHEGSQLKITYQLDDDFEPNTLMLSIQETYCPVTKEHGKMTCVCSEFSHEDQSLTVTYQCQHLKCRIPRVCKVYLPKLWEEAKDVLKNVKLVSIILNPT